MYNRNNRGGNSSQFNKPYDNNDKLNMLEKKVLDIENELQPKKTKQTRRGRRRGAPKQINVFSELRDLKEKVRSMEAAKIADEKAKLEVEAKLQADREKEKEKKLEEEANLRLMNQWKEIAENVVKDAMAAKTLAEEEVVTKQHVEEKSVEEKLVEVKPKSAKKPWYQFW